MVEAGVVAIGGNEGDRLRGHLQSALSTDPTVIYPDSSSCDGSTESAPGLGVPVVELDTPIPLGPARARNAGVGRLLQLNAAARFIQFVDSDCELSDE